MAVGVDQPWNDVAGQGHLVRAGGALELGQPTTDDPRLVLTVGARRGSGRSGATTVAMSRA